MEDNSKSVQVTDVQWAKVGVKGIVQQCVVDGEVDWLWSSFYGGRTSLLSC